MAFAPATRVAMDEGMCAPPPVDAAKWKLIQTNGISMLVPPGFNQISRQVDHVLFGTGAKNIGIAHGEGPDQASTKGAVAMVIGTNVRERMLHAPSTVQLRVISANAGVSYAAEKAVVCPP